MTPKLFSEMGLSAEVLKAIGKLGFEQASPIQAEAIPVLMQGRDVVGQSETGSGKTAAFAVPAIEKVDPQKGDTQVLILCPTRELAVQVSEEVHKLALFKRGIRILPIYGGQSYERQLQGLRQGAQIVIGTPGRIMDHMQRGTLHLEAVKMAILDEADVMLNMGFREDIEFILKAVPAERQTVFFCATLPRAILQLIQTFAREPQNVRIEQKTLTVPTVEQVYYEVLGRYKIELLTRLIDVHDFRFGIIFCNTKRMVDDLVDHLEAQGYLADRLHGDMSQPLRDRVMNKFRKSGLEFLVATDVAARGIDVDDVEVVFNYDLPYDVEDYVHRIGRTGRAGRSGMAISFVAGREMFQLYNIERYAKVRIRRGRAPTADEVEEARANVFLDRLRAVLQSREFRPQDHLVERLLEEGFNSTDVASALIHLLQGGEAPPVGKPVAANPPRERSSPRQERVPVQQPRGLGDQEWKESPPRREPRPAAAKPAKIRPATPPPAAAPVAVSQQEEPVATVPGPESVAPVPTAAATVASAQAAPPESISPPSVPAPSPTALAVAQPAVPAQPVAPTAPSRPSTEPTPPGSPSSPAPTPPRPKLIRPRHRTPDGQTCLHLNIGEQMGITPIDIVTAIAGHTGLPGKVVGKVDIRERHSFVDVAAEHVKGIIAKLNRAEIKGCRVKVKVA
jgi:ATP-dependent RNA helicase DeaD